MQADYLNTIRNTEKNVTTFREVIVKGARNVNNDQVPHSTWTTQRL